MANQTSDLEQRAREVLEVIECSGLDWVRGTQLYAPCLTYGLERGLFDQRAVDAANKIYEREKTRKVLGDNQDYNAYLTALMNELFDQSAVDGGKGDHGGGGHRRNKAKDSDFDGYGNK